MNNKILYIKIPDSMIACSS